MKGFVNEPTPDALTGESPVSRRQARAAGIALISCLVLAYLVFLISTGGAVDTAKNDGYLAASRWTGLQEILAHRRTFAYPQFLRLLRHVSPELGLLPHLQSGLFLGAVGLYFAALRRFGVAPWTAFFAAAPVAASTLHVAMAPRVLTETLGTAAIVCTLALLLEVVARPSRWTWTGLAVALFFAYQIRPANVFLVGIVPLLAFVLRPPGERPRAWRSSLRRAALTATVAVVPLLAFCGLRWFVVGHFGLVSFGGFNVIGIAGSLISPATLEALPEDARPVARFLHQQRRAHDLKPLVGRRFRDSRARFRTWYGEFDQNVAFARAWSRFHTLDAAGGEAGGAKPPAPRGSKERTGPDGEWQALGTYREWVEENRQLSALSLALLRQQPALYREWITQSLLGSLRWMWKHLLGLSWVVYALGAALLLLAVRAVRAGRAFGSLVTLAIRRALATAAPILWLAAASFTANLLLIVLVEVYKRRYIEAAAILVPGALCALVWELLRARIPRHSPEAERLNHR